MGSCDHTFPQIEKNEATISALLAGYVLGSLSSIKIDKPTPEDLQELKKVVDNWKGFSAGA